MTKVSAPITADTREAAHLPLVLRIAFALFALLGVVFCAGLMVGIIVSAIEQGAIRPRAIALLLGAVVGLGLFGFAGWWLSAHWRQPARSAYDRRYKRMMVFLLVSGLPLGILLGLAGEGGTQATLLSNDPLNPGLAGLAAAVLVVVLCATLTLYHRTIDDHEQQAYLWANSIAFYFLAIALPVAWLLARGRLIPPIGIGSAMLILLAAALINFTVWAWLKYR